MDTLNLPPYDLQFCAQTGVDAMDCLEESLRNLVYIKTSFYASARVMAFNAGVTLDGSDITEALGSAMVKYEGLVPNSLYPTPTGTWTWKTYYQVPPQSILAQYVPVTLKLIQTVGEQYTWVIIRLPNEMQHGVVRLTGTPGKFEGTFCDSEPGGQVKNFGYYNETIVWESGVEVQGVFFVQSTGFTPEEFAAFSPEVQTAIKANDSGGHNVIINGQIIPNP